MKRVMWIVLDGLGAGEAPDAGTFGDLGSNTLGNIAKQVFAKNGKPLHIPNLMKLGVERITPIAGASDPSHLIGAYGKALEKSQGKDTTSGHWEMTGLVVDQAFPVFEKGFTQAIMQEWVRENNLPGYLGNKPASGTEILEELGMEHILTGKPIVYT